MRISLCLFAAALLPLSTVHAAQLTGRASLFGSAARAEPGDIGNTGSGDRTLTSDQQSLRLMLDDAQDKVEWSLHVKTARQHLRGIPPAAGHSSDLFRYHPWAGDWVDKTGTDSSTRVGYELTVPFTNAASVKLRRASAASPSTGAAAASGSR